MQNYKSLHSGSMKVSPSVGNNTWNSSSQGIYPAQNQLSDSYSTTMSHENGYYPGGYPPGPGGANVPHPHYQGQNAATGYVITQQPGASVLNQSYASAPASGQVSVGMVPVGVPPGLEYLTQLDTIFMTQKIEAWELFTGCETKNKYKIFDNANHQIFHAKEDTDCCTRNCCGPLRPFEMGIKNMRDEEVIRLKRPLACGSCCFPCCLQSIEVLSSAGVLLGSVQQEWSLCTPKFLVQNEYGENVLRIEGPCITCRCCADVEFHVLSLDGSSKVGKISKKWSGIAREMFTDADNFGISFPLDLSVKTKATMIGACMLIDFMFFEHTDDHNS